MYLLINLELSFLSHYLQISKVEQFIMHLGIFTYNLLILRIVPILLIAFYANN